MPFVLGELSLDVAPVTEAPEEGVEDAATDSVSVTGMPDTTLVIADGVGLASTEGWEVVGVLTEVLVDEDVELELLEDDEDDKDEVELALLEEEDEEEPMELVEEAEEVVDALEDALLVVDEEATEEEEEDDDSAPAAEPVTEAGSPPTPSTTIGVEARLCLISRFKLS